MHSTSLVDMLSLVVMLTYCEYLASHHIGNMLRILKETVITKYHLQLFSNMCIDVLFVFDVIGPGLLVEVFLSPALVAIQVTLKRNVVWNLNPNAQVE